MKTLAIITLFATANAGTTCFAHAADKPVAIHPITNEVSELTKRLEAFKSQVAFHERNVSVLWQQYDLAVQRIQNQTGSHADLARDEAFFVGVYQQDIDNGIRVEESQKAIAEIKVRYARAHEQRTAQEARHIAVLQTQLKKELKREAKALKKTKEAHASLAKTLPMLTEVEQYIHESIKRADMLLSDTHKTIIATR
ncbi:hypothetical protein JHJ32_09645 [Parapedobacter sp. ISTM3]|uniref:Uncharacterized protein n=1 Tax=Parapedobacter luteus TaxID=623280 RepID=A0A1T5AU76_9SPHI|nr:MULTISPECIES: hypothetical protein [Parapedobacter]MBK1440248.1 hypothetical protein [Parapedobacter sp. ISTM3]SKB38572.1 hypothetical protein SAMN05660226_01064 [Parapedobacter luteus]